jgi:hypothetical protein
MRCGHGGWSFRGDRRTPGGGNSLFSYNGTLDSIPLGIDAGKHSQYIDTTSVGAVGVVGAAFVVDDIVDAHADTVDSGVSEVVEVDGGYDAGLNDSYTDGYLDGFDDHFADHV